MATVTERLELLITSNARDAISGIKEAEGSFGGLGTKLSAFDDKMAGTNAKLQSLGLAGVSSGTLLAGGIAVGAGAVVGLTALVGEGINKQLALADAVRGVAEASGLTAEKASAAVEVFGDYGVKTDTVEQAMFRLSRTALDTPDKLAAVGVEIERNRDGSIDLFGTLNNVQDAYKNAGSAAEKNAILFEAFGKQGINLIPVLERTKDLAQELASVPQSRILSQEDLDNAEAYRLAMDDLGDAMDALQRQLGAAVIPVLTQFATAISTGLEGLNTATGSIGGLSGALSTIVDIGPLAMPLHGLGAASELMAGHFRNAGEEAVRSFGAVGMGIAGIGEKIGIFDSGSDSSNRFADAQKRVAEATQEVARLAADDSASSADLKAAKRELADAQADLADKTNAVASALQSENDQQAQAKLLADQRIGGLIGLASADLQYQDAVAKRADAEAKLNALIDEGTTSGREYESATRAVEQADIAVVAAGMSVESQVQSLTAQVKNGTLSHAEYEARVDALRQKYPEMGAAIDAVTGQVMAHHAEIDAVPDHHNTNFTATDNVSWMVDRIKSKVASVFDQASGTLSAIGGAARAAGGPVSANSLYMVGERGPELFVPSTAGQIVPNHQLGTVGGGTNNYQISVTVAPGGSPAETGRAIVEAIRAYENRSGATWRAA